MALAAELNEYPFVTFAKQPDSPPTPDPGLGRAFMKSDGLPYFLNDDGVEMLLFQDLDITAAGLFRGEWATDTLAYVEDFSAGSIPAIYTHTETGAGQAPFASTVAASGISGGPPGSYLGAVVFPEPQILNGNETRLTLDLFKLGIANITRVKYWLGHPSQNNDNYRQSGALKNGVQQSARAGNYAWVQEQITATEADSIGWNEFGATSVPATVTAYMRMTGVEVYATPAPYMLGQYVLYAGRLWRSLLDHNVNVPGATGWAPVPLSGVTVNPQTASYVCALTDAGGLVTMTNAAATTVTIPANATVGYPIGSRVEVANLGAGLCTLTAAASVTFVADSGLSLALAQGQTATATKVATNTWVVKR